ncbi:MAG: hypothetical protein ACRCZO_19000 [Cetobacterium sp.]
MDNRGFFKILNEFYKGKPMQFLPAFSSTTAPPFPHATYQIRSHEADLIAIDERDRVGDKIIEYGSQYVVEELFVKCYEATEEKAYNLSQEVLDLIIFTLKDKINFNGYGIINATRLTQQHEKTENSYIYCYILQIKIDFNRKVTREFDVLKVVELDRDIKDKIILEV